MPAGAGGSPWLSGTRVKARANRADGGAEVLSGYYDTALALGCTLGQTSDGVVRCVGGAQPYFADAACTQPVVREAPGCTARAFAYETLGRACDTVPAKVEVYETGAKLTTKPEQIYSRRGDACVAESTRSYDVYSATKADPKRFLAYAEKSEAHGGATAHVYEGEDGSRVLHAWSRGDTKEVCHFFDEFRVDEGASVACLPHYGLLGSYFQDEGCTKPAAYDHFGCGVKKAIRYIAPMDACKSYSAEVHDVGAELSSRYWGTPQSCGLLGEAQPRMFEVGPVADLSGLPQAKSVLRGTGRLRALALETSGYAFQPNQSGFFDTQTKAYCKVYVFADGQRRCLPEHMISRFPGEVQAFVDSACTKPAARLVLSPDCARIPPGLVTYVANPETCGAARAGTVNALGAKISTGTFYARPPGTDGCTESTIPDTLEYYEIGAELPLDYPTVTAIEN